MKKFDSPIELSGEIQESEDKLGRISKPISFVDKNGKVWTRDDFKEETDIANDYGKNRYTMYYDKGVIGKDNRSPERQKQGLEWIRQETERQLKTNPGKDRIAHFIYGNGGVGKSSYIDKYIQGNEPSLVMDSDIFTENYIPESKFDPNNKDANPERHYYTQAVHDESSYYRDQMFDPLLKEGYNVVIPKVNPKLSDIQKMKDLGYKVKATFLDAPKDVSRLRGLMRRVNGGRFLPTSLYADPEVLQRNFQSLIDSGLLDDYFHYNAGNPDFSLKLLRSKNQK